MTYEDDGISSEILKNYKHLAAAILLKTVEDIKAKPSADNTPEYNRQLFKNKKSAEKFMNGKDKWWFNELCIFADVDAKEIRRRLNKINNAKQKILSWEELKCLYQERLKNGKIG